MPRERRRLTLRTRLLVVVVALLATVCAAVGALTAIELRTFLIGRLDGQLAAAGGRSVDAGRPDRGGTTSGNPNGNPNGNPDKGAQFLLTPGQSAGTLGARVVGSKVDAAAVLGTNGTLSAVSTAQVAPLAGVAADGHTHTVDLGRLGTFRVIASRTDSGQVLITGLPLAEVTRTVDRLILIELLVAAGAVLVAGGAGLLLLQRNLRPLRRVAATASRVSTLPLARGEVQLTERLEARDVDEHTEVGQVAGAVNRLLDHVGSALTARHESETRVRRFVADASHELRTPLTAIRGYAELTRRDRASAPPQLAHAMERVESEAQRMTAMVEDLLLLARLDAGRELESDPVDLTHLLLDAVSDANASGRDHDWRLDVPDDPITVTGDASALHQVIANLLANARMHTPPGTTVTITAAPSVPGAVVTVEDDGPGIAEDVLPTVFERFARGESARSRTAGSTGLGLAIVHAIVQAHDGTIEVTSRPGRTVFTLRLPS